LPESASVLLNRLLTRGKFRHVQILLKLAELGSVQRTAEAIGTTQSSVTQTLAYLEDLLQVQLFHRHARGVRPTPAGSDLLPVARHLMLGIAESAEVITARRNQGHTSVRLFASMAAVNGLLVRSLPAFHERMPAVQVVLHEAEGGDQLLAIARGEVDLVVCRKPAVVPQGWRFQELQVDRLAVVCAATHARAGARSVRWKDLAGETWLLPPTDTFARRHLDAELAALGADVKTYPLVTRALGLTRWLLLERGMVTLLPLSIVQHLIDAGELVELKMREVLSLQPLGFLLPEHGGAEAAHQLAAFLAHAASGSGRARSPRPAR
jgi:DNA-binding transcriptional LysR family regulator